MEASASAPRGPHIEPEPREWQPRANWVNARLLCGAASFFFAAFVFGYFYLRSLDVANRWKIGAVNPSIGLGIAIAASLLLSAVLLRIAVLRPPRALALAAGALFLALLSIALQAIEWSVLGFGPASGGYASVYVGWTVLYAVFTLFCAYWIETQVATIWRSRREGPGLGGAELLSSGLEACSFFWCFYVGIGLLAFVILYLV
jgi:heme/copper-type cytochrome/quinol oxidase subunit 3